MTIRRFVRFLAVLLTLTGVAACQTVNPIQQFPTLTFQHKTPLSMDVSRVEVVTKYASPMADPNVEHLFPTTPEDGLKQWVADRIVTSGTHNMARFTILNAAAVEQALPRTQGVKGTFTKDQSEKYVVKVEAMLEIVDDSGRVLGHTASKVGRSRTLAEDATLNERERFWFDLTEALLNDFDIEMEKGVRTHLVNWLR